MLVVKANRALLRKRRSYSEIREAYEGYTNETQLHFKELTPFEQKKIRDKIIAQAKRDRLMEIRMYFLTLFVLAFFVFVGYLIFSN
ncbi:hypothetical protein [Flagellimonas myxillae]|uniref:hypothetical protein n=1 Tax=Flagellimonas myxillae TaxID=2942214 RepID=UPI00201EB78F|nr:hypothetical protein [Muricauda myxillae]MCL6267406.1 hypothetical protein [Muricauda myxillae]